MMTIMDREHTVHGMLCMRLHNCRPVRVPMLTPDHYIVKPPGGFNVVVDQSTPFKDLKTNCRISLRFLCLIVILSIFCFLYVFVSVRQDQSVIDHVLYIR